MQWQSHLLAGAFATLLVLATLPDTAEAACCNTGYTRKVIKDVPGLGRVDTYQRVCGDCTPAHSTYCGINSCNIFGCNCVCREGDCDNIRRRRDVAFSGEAIMNAGDINGDGNFSIAEAEVFLSEKGIAVNKRALRSLDVNDDGSLTADEIEFPVTGNGQ